MLPPIKVEKLSLVHEFVEKELALGSVEGQNYSEVSSCDNLSIALNKVLIINDYAINKVPELNFIGNSLGGLNDSFEIFIFAFTPTSRHGSSLFIEFHFFFSFLFSSLEIIF
ncbi:MAG: hypothetical protein GY938_14235 [Ketobacter sp.]|nr:hypothetical protein [Ketobacter sp.]